ncbi:hypothetical protein BDM02DRAFT_3187865 [Thelephora ganbajun]|uniref:Uncharacterized protein n=1 Tax=Thelephora ganbajun TaxID=370292 RepID=A0ACB6ZDB4_THEGA|nr:hypothetical protein BDM02DRAFT_3187865 [Thelephora ganbajun]
MKTTSCCSRECNPQIDRVYEKLTETFRNLDPTTSEINRALEAMELIIPLSEIEFAGKNYELFRALKRFDPAEPSFVHGICYAYRDDKPLQLRKAALFFLPLVGDRWFNTPGPVHGAPSNDLRSCVDLASAVDSIGHTSESGAQKAALAVLFGMINSPHWRPHIVMEKCKLLEIPYFDTIANVLNSAAMILLLEFLWLEYKELIPGVQEQLEADLEKAKGALTKYNIWSINPTAIALWTKIDDLQQVRDSLVALEEG